MGRVMPTRAFPLTGFVSLGDRAVLVDESPQVLISGKALAEARLASLQAQVSRGGLGKSSTCKLGSSGLARGALKKLDLQARKLRSRERTFEEARLASSQAQVSREDF